MLLGISECCLVAILDGYCLVFGCIMNMKIQEMIMKGIDDNDDDDDEGPQPALWII